MKHAKVIGSAVALMVAAGTASAQWSDDFDSYPVGPLNSGGWDGWDGDPAAYGIVTTDQARSAPNSLEVINNADAIYQFNGAYTSGQWTVTGYIYVPSNLDSLTYWIIQNEYNHFGPYDWTVEVHLDPTLGIVTEEIQNAYGDGTNEVPLVFDEWVQVRSEFDIDANNVTTYYNDQMLASGFIDVRNFGPLEIANLDLYAPHAVGVYHDDVSVTEGLGGDPCVDGYANCNGDGDVNTQDFLCYLGLWSAGDPAADCNGDGTVNTQDFLCYLGLWSGCQ